MEDDQSFNITKSAEQEKWLAEHIVLNRQFIEEAQQYKIKPLTNEFWVYYHHRDYEKYGRYGWCVAGIAQMAEDCGITQKQVENSYYQLVQKGAIQHIWCESKVYRGKSKLYASTVLLKEKGIQVSSKNLSDGRERKLPEYKEAIILDCDLTDTPVNFTGKSVNFTGKSVNFTGKSVNFTGKSDLNNSINNSINNSNKQYNVPTKVRDDRSYLLAERLHKWILHNKPNRKISPNWKEQWALSIDKMHRIDGRSWEDIAAAIDWCQKDSFWMFNILSGEKLREKYDTLDDQAMREKSKISSHDIASSLSKMSEREIIEKFNKMKGQENG